MSFKQPTSAALVLSLAATAAAADQEQFGDALWRWTELVGADAESSFVVSRPGQYTLQFQDEGRYAVRADCNTGGGSYEIDNGTLKLAPGAMTLAACPPGSKSDRYLELLFAASAFRLEEGRLELTSASGERMLFEAQREISLPGTAWLVRAYNNGRGGVVSILQNSRLSALFSTDRRILGFAGCNDYSASAEISGSEITIGPALSTRKACDRPRGIMQQETEFLAALPSAHRFDVRGGRLQIRTEDNALAVDLYTAVTGELRFADPPKLASDARITLQIQDVSRADAPARVVGETVLAAAGKEFPTPFEIPFDLADIDPRHTYSVGVRVTGEDDELRYISTRIHPTITRGAPIWDVNVLLERVD